MKIKVLVVLVLMVFLLFYPAWEFFKGESTLFEKRQCIKVAILSDSLQCERYKAELRGYIDASSQYKETADEIALYGAGSESERLEIELRMLKKKSAFLEKMTSLIDPLIKIYSNDMDSMKVIFKKTKKNSSVFLNIRKLFPFNGKGMEAFDSVNVFALSKLQTPGTAKFASYTDDQTATCKKGSRYGVSSYVDAQNTYGATIRQKFFGVVEQGKDGKWHLLEFMFF
jgi:hypothetical protein